MWPSFSIKRHKILVLLIEILVIYCYNTTYFKSNIVKIYFLHDQSLQISIRNALANIYATRSSEVKGQLLSLLYALHNRSGLLHLHRCFIRHQQSGAPGVQTLPALDVSVCDVVVPHVGSRHGHAERLRQKGVAARERTLDEAGSTERQVVPGGDHLWFYSYVQGKNITILSCALLAVV